MLRRILSMPVIRWFHAKPKRAVIVFFAALFVLGLTTYRHYGVPYDEGTLDSLARDAHAYVFKGAEWPTNPSWRYHGTLIELPLYVLEEWISPLGSPSSNDKRLYVRHFFGAFLFLVLSAYLMYVHARRATKNIWWGLLGALLFLLLPRIYAHGFYNTRDIPQIAMFALAMFTLLRVLDVHTYSRATLHGIAIALALSLRLSALILLPITFLFLGIEYMRSRQRGTPERALHFIALGATTTAASVLATWLFWPFLWEAPIAHFHEAYAFMSNLGSETFIFGRMYDHFPWFYIPLWIAVTVPVVVFVLCIVGIMTSALGIGMQSKTLSAEARDRLVYLCWLIAPVVAILVSGAGIYLEWRHVFFLAPAIILLALLGFRDLLDWSRPKKWIHTTLIGVLTLQLCATGFWMMRNHPHQFMYYSIPLKIAVPLFLPDYWALSYRTTSEKALELAPARIFTLYSDENVAYQNMYTVFPVSLTRAMRVPSPEEAMLVMTRSPEIAKNLEPLHLVQVDGVTINGVYKGGQYPLR